MTAGELNFQHLGKRVTVSGAPDWSVSGALYGVSHRCPNAGPDAEFETVLTLMFDGGQRPSAVLVPPGATAVVDGDING